MARRTRLTHLFFEISVIAKGVDGILELAGGAMLLFVSPAQIHALLRALTQHELSEDPHDFVARYLLNGSSHVTAGAATFAAAYLLWHGAVKVGLVIGLLLKRRWAYPVAIVAFIVFVIYQMYRWSHTRSAGLLVLSALDVIVIVLTWLEYKRLESMHGFARR